MQTHDIPADGAQKVARLLQHSNLFARLSDAQMQKVVEHCELRTYDPGEEITRAGNRAEGFFVLLKGEVVVNVGSGKRQTEVARLRTGEVFGETALLLDEPRSADVLASTEARVAYFSDTIFDTLTERVPAFGLALSRTLAARLAKNSATVPLPEHDLGAQPPSSDAIGLLAPGFMVRHRVVPIALKENVLSLGVVDDPSSLVMDAIHKVLPTVKVESLRVDPVALSEVLRKLGSTSETPETAVREAGKLPDLDELLTRMVAEGASDVHLSAGQPPHWRIDGEMDAIEGEPVLGEEDVLAMFEGKIPKLFLDEFMETNDTDFAYALPGQGRFRVNLFRDAGGIGSVLRHIPEKILTIEQLGLPPVVRRFCDFPKGLVLVTGPTGSGKSTSLAAMIDHINETRKEHIITLEDPIEFVHPSKRCLVNQREVGTHTDSFGRALRAALREDPDIVLVGEMRDLETVELALETANTGHLVFGTLHTATAISTVDRVIDLFPAEQQNQIRSVLADVLLGVVSQTLCRRREGGRIAVVEIMVVNPAVANLVRQGKAHQIPNVMQSGKKLGNLLLNDELARLVKAKTITPDEAIAHAVDKQELANAIGVSLESLA